MAKKTKDTFIFSTRPTGGDGNSDSGGSDNSTIPDYGDAPF